MNCFFTYYNKSRQPFVSGVLIFLEKVSRVWQLLIIIVKISAKILYLTKNYIKLENTKHYYLVFNIPRV